MKKLIYTFLLVFVALAIIGCGDDNVQANPPVVENEITLGKYPQNEVFDEIIISELESLSSNSNGYIKYNNKEYYKLDGRCFEVAPITWKKITVNGKTMYMSDKILDESKFLSENYFEVSIYPYSKKPGAPEETYANNYQYSDVREFLNNTFYNIAFTTEEKNKLQKVEYDGLSDYIYTLSIEELNEEMPLPTSATAYAVARGCEQIYDTQIDYKFNGNATWWLRTPNIIQLWRAAGISYEGVVLEYIDCHNNKIGVRPVICLK